MDATKKPLFIPPEFANYAEKHGLFQMYEKILQKLIIAQPDDPISYMIDILKVDNDEAPRIIVHGPPASGKRTMSKMIEGKLKCIHITLQSLADQSELECDAPALKKVKELTEANKDIPADVWVDLIKDRIKQIDCVKKGWLLEGFPRTRDEALVLQMAGIAPEHFVLLDAPDTVLIERVMGKRIDPVTGDVYHVTFDWPTDPVIVDRLVPDPNSTEEVMIKRLMEYHRHSGGILRCYENVYKVINCDQPKSDVFSQVITYLTVMKRSPAPHTPRVILLGPTGAGKAVQAALIASKYNLIDVSCNELIEQSLVNDSKTGQAIKPYINRGMQVPDDLIVELLKARLGQMDAIRQGWVIHGFPKNREQAESLNRIGFEANRVIYMDVPMDALLERLTLCSIDPVTGERYHSLYNPPMSNEVKERLETDPKNSKAEIRERVLTYQDHIEDIADYYQDLGQHVNADQDPHTVFECIESIIVNPIPKKA